MGIQHANWWLYFGNHLEFNRQSDFNARNSKESEILPTQNGTVAIGFSCVSSACWLPVSIRKGTQPTLPRVQLDTHLGNPSRRCQDGKLCVRCHLCHWRKPCKAPVTDVGTCRISTETGWIVAETIRMSTEYDNFNQNQSLWKRPGAPWHSMNNE
jgi:hypothetical protein